MDKLNIEIISQKYQRRKLVGMVYFPIVFLITLLSAIIAAIIPSLSGLFLWGIIFFSIFWMLGIVFIPSIKIEEKIVYHLNMAQDNIEDIKIVKKEIASSIEVLEEFLSELEKFLFVESVIKPLSKLTENIRQRIYPALDTDTAVAEGLIRSTLECFLSGDMKQIESINTEIGSKLAESSEKQVLYYEMPKLHIRIYEASNGIIVKFWHKSPYSRFFITLIILLGGYWILTNLTLIKIDNTIIAALIGASALLAATSK